MTAAGHRIAWLLSLGLAAAGVLAARPEGRGSAEQAGAGVGEHPDAVARGGHEIRAAVAGDVAHVDALGAVAGRAVGRE